MKKESKAKIKRQRRKEHPRQIGAWVTENQFKKFHKRGGSAWLRKLIDAAA